MTTPNPGWTDERVGDLKRLWIEGLSAAEIARRLRWVTRNSVIGKLHRLGFSGRETPSAPRATRPRAPRPRAISTRVAPAPRAAKPPAAPILKVVPMLCEPVELLDLQPHHCRYPVNQDGADYLACGSRKVDGKPYCVDHSRLAFQKAQPTDNTRKEAARAFRDRLAA